MSGYDPSASILAGMSEAELQSRLVALQSAYLDLVSGAQAVTVAYAQGNGSKSVTFKAANLGEIAVAIRQLQAQLGLTTTPRRAIGFTF